MYRPKYELYERQAKECFSFPGLMEKGATEEPSLGEVVKGIIKSVKTVEPEIKEKKPRSKKETAVAVPKAPKIKGAKIL